MVILGSLRATWNNYSTRSPAREARDMVKREEGEKDVKVNTMKLFLSAREQRSTFRDKVISKCELQLQIFCLGEGGEGTINLLKVCIIFFKKISSSCFSICRIPFSWPNCNPPPPLATSIPTARETWRRSPWSCSGLREPPVGELKLSQ